MKVTLFTLVIFFICGCANVNSETTPIKYKNKTKVSDYFYLKNKKSLTDSIKKFINDKSLAYYNKENDLLTEIIIDSIIYSPTKDKAAFFVITKNSDDKLLSEGKKSEYNFDAHCFIVHLKSDTAFFDISWVSASNISNFSSLEKISKRIREMYFNDFKERKGVEDKSLYKYNLDDIRFWEGPVWMVYNNG